MFSVAGDCVRNCGVSSSNLDIVISSYGEDKRPLLGRVLLSLISATSCGKLLLITFTLTLNGNCYFTPTRLDLEAETEINSKMVH